VWAVYRVGYLEKATGWFFNTFNIINYYFDVFLYMCIFVATFKLLPAVNLGDEADCVLHFTCHIYFKSCSFHSSPEQLSQSRVCL
jgi:cellulose synthase/poly-beta-1,6-N-acetylglucosamine synthase-like glycosyltransferase